MPLRSIISQRSLRSLLVTACLLSNWSGSFPEIGGLMSYGPYLVDEYRRAAAFLDRILMGEKPIELPIQAPVMIPPNQANEENVDAQCTMLDEYFQASSIIKKS